MPALGVSANDAGDLIAYLDVEEARLNAMRDASAQPPPHDHSHHDHHH